MSRHHHGHEDDYHYTSGSSRRDYRRYEERQYGRPYDRYVPSGRESSSGYYGRQGGDGYYPPPSRRTSDRYYGSESRHYSSTSSSHSHSRYGSRERERDLAEGRIERQKQEAEETRKAHAELFSYTKPFIEELEQLKKETEKKYMVEFEKTLAVETLKFEVEKYSFDLHRFDLVTENLEKIFTQQ